MLFESLSHVINQESHVYSWNLGKIYHVHSLKFWNFPSETSVSLSQIFLLNMWLLVQVTLLLHVELKMFGYRESGVFTVSI